MCAVQVKTLKNVFPIKKHFLTPSSGWALKEALFKCHMRTKPFSGVAFSH
jgi:hypothetical protein